jgi:hypothetical protein
MPMGQERFNDCPQHDELSTATYRLGGSQAVIVALRGNSQS